MSVRANNEFAVRETWYLERLHILALYASPSDTLLPKFQAEIREELLRTIFGEQPEFLLHLMECLRRAI